MYIKLKYEVIEIGESTEDWAIYYRLSDGMYLCRQHSPNTEESWAVLNPWTVIRNLGSIDRHEGRSAYPGELHDALMFSKGCNYHPDMDEN